MVGKGLPQQLPKCLYLETTNRCNLRCRTCIIYRGAWEQDRDISCEELSMIVGQLPGLERAVLHGIGEPLLNKKLPAMIRLLTDRGVTVLFNTNGILLNEKKQEELINAKLDEVRVSIDAASSHGYNAIRGSDKFDLIIRNVRTMVKRLAFRNVVRPKPSFWFLGNQQNIVELPGLLQLAADIGVQEVHLQRLVYSLDNEGYGLAMPNQALTNPHQRVCQLIEQSQEQARQLGIRFSASGRADPIQSVRGRSPNETPWKRCLRPWEVIYITVQGNVLPCCISPFSTADYPSIILGNIFENSLAEIWFGERYQTFRKKHQSASPAKCCRGCGIYWSL